MMEAFFGDRDQHTDSNTLVFFMSEKVHHPKRINTNALALVEKGLNVVFLADSFVFRESLRGRHNMKRFGRQEVYFFLLFFCSATIYSSMAMVME
jgi:hypothetical protein